MVMLIIPFLNGCQKEELMMSESKISEQIAYNWSQQFTPSETKMVWQFKDGNVIIFKNDKIHGQGTYKVECSLTKAKVKIDGFSGGNNYMNDTWQVLTLDKQVLVITNMDKGTQVYEFIRAE